MDTGISKYNWSSPYYCQIKPNKGSELLRNLTDPHITLVTYFIRLDNKNNDKTDYTNKINGLLNKSKDITKTLRHKLIKHLNERKIVFNGNKPFVTLSKKTPHYAIELNMKGTSINSNEYEFKNLEFDTIMMMKNIWKDYNIVVDKHTQFQTKENNLPKLLNRVSVGTEDEVKEDENYRDVELICLNDLNNEPLIICLRYNPPTPHMSIVATNRVNNIGPVWAIEDKQIRSAIISQQRGGDLNKYYKKYIKYKKMYLSLKN